MCSGYFGCRVVPARRVVDSDSTRARYAINHAIFKMETAGQDITERVLELSRKHGICDPTIRTAQAMKEKVPRARQGHCPGAPLEKLRTLRRDGRPKHALNTIETPALQTP